MEAHFARIGLIRSQVNSSVRRRPATYVIRVSVLEDDPKNEIRDRILSAHRLLNREFSHAGRQAQRMLREIVVADIRAQPIVVRRGRLILGLEYARRSPPELLALIMVYAAVRCRLNPYVRRSTSADRRAHYWQRIAREVLEVAIVLDKAEDRDGYIVGISSGRWEAWAREWLGRRAVGLVEQAKAWRDTIRDMRRLGVPKWLRRTLATLWACRSAPSNDR